MGLPDHVGGAVGKVRVRIMVRTVKVEDSDKGKE